MSIQLGFVKFHLSSGGHWKAIMSTPLRPPSTVTVHAKCIILRCLTTGVTVMNGTSSEPLAATSVSNESISPLYKVYSCQGCLCGLVDLFTFQACITVTSDNPL
jgi:hypothetical protein